MTSLPPLTTKYCHACAASIDSRAEICPKCGVRQPNSDQQSPTSASPGVQDTGGTKIAAGLCGILLGALGVHKFILGFTKAGLIMLLVSVLTCGIGAIPMSVIGLIEGIIYLCKSDQEFHRLYVAQKKDWF